MESEARSELAARIVAEGSPSPTLAELQRQFLDDLDLLYDVPDPCKWCGQVHWTMDEAVACWTASGCPTSWPEGWTHGQ